MGTNAVRRDVEREKQNAFSLGILPPPEISENAYKSSRQHI